MGRTSKVLALLALAVAGAGAVAGLAIYLVSARESSAPEAHVDSSVTTHRSLVLTWVRTGESFRIRRSCGFIRALGRRIAIDIAEGRFPLTCGAARFVMSRYLSRRFVRYGTLRYASLTFECYQSRPDGVGWDYHCMTGGPAAAAYVDVGAGRRPHR